MQWMSLLNVLMLLNILAFNNIQHFSVQRYYVISSEGNSPLSDWYSEIFQHIVTLNGKVMTTKHTKLIEVVLVYL